MTEPTTGAAVPPSEPYYQALVKEADRILTRTGYLPIEKMAAAVVAELEPLIRDHIAQQIENTGTPSSHWDCSDAWAEALELAACIARGER